MIEYRGEIKTELKNTLACLSGAQMGLNHKKTGGQKSRDTLPLISFKLKQITDEHQIRPANQTTEHRKLPINLKGSGL